MVELEREFQVARVTVRQAVDVLCEEGLLRCHQGRGTFVSERPPDRHWLKLATDWDAEIARIRNNVLRRIRVDSPPPFPDREDGEGTLADEYVFLRSVQYKELLPYGLVNVHVARNIYQRDPNAFLERPAMLVLDGMRDLDIRQARQTVVVGSADPQAADYLKIGLGEPTAQTRIVITDADGIAIYVANITYRSDAIQLHIDLLANGQSGAAQLSNIKCDSDHRPVSRQRTAAARRSRRARLSS